MKQLIQYISAIIILLGCSKATSLSQEPVFEAVPAAVAIKPGIIDEASGLADSHLNAGHLWVEQDSGNPPELALLDYKGGITKKIHIRNASNRDWEDMAIAKSASGRGYDVYVADIGDNNLQYSSYIIYRFEEPSVDTDTVHVVEKISFRYPNGPHDAEAILVDQAKNLYVFTKEETKSGIYKLAYPQSASVNDAVLIGYLPFRGVVSAALSGGGDEIILKTYAALYYWRRNAKEEIEAVLKHPAKQLSYKQEAQGEGICFKNDGTGFFTLSEKPFLSAFVNLNFYKRK